MVNPIPDGHHTISPHLIVDDAAKAIEFYKKAFGAESAVCMTGPDGKSVMHAELKIGNSIFMLAGEFPEHGCVGPKTVGGTPVSIHLYVEDCEKVFNQAIAAGATASMPITEMFWGDRFGKLTDPFGHQWSVATHIKDMTPEEMQKAGDEWMKQQGPGGGCGEK